VRLEARSEDGARRIVEWRRDPGSAVAARKAAAPPEVRGRQFDCRVRSFDCEVSIEIERRKLAVGGLIKS